MKDRRKPDAEEVLEFFGKEVRPCLVIVEGKKDAKALNTLDVTNIIPVNGRSLSKVAEHAAQLLGMGLQGSPEPPERAGSPYGHKAGKARDPGNQGKHPGRDTQGAGKKYSDIIILTDFDREGRHIAARLSVLLRARRIHPNQRLRSRIMAFGFNKIEDFKMDSILRLGREPKRCPARALRNKNKERGDFHVKASSNIHEIRDKGRDKGQRSCREA